MSPALSQPEISRGSKEPSDNPFADYEN
jgi:hypothetical protein